MTWNYRTAAASGTISRITSTGNTISVTAPTGPTVNVDVASSYPGPRLSIVTVAADTTLTLVNNGYARTELTTGSHTFTINDTSATNALAGDWYDVANTGTGTLTIAQAQAQTITSQGNVLTLPTGATGRLIYEGGNAWTLNIITPAPVETTWAPTPTGTPTFSNIVGTYAVLERTTTGHHVVRVQLSMTVVNGGASTSITIPLPSTYTAVKDQMIPFQQLGVGPQGGFVLDTGSAISVNIPAAYNNEVILTGTLLLAP